VDEGLIASLPDAPGVYLLRDAEGQVVYVGKSCHVRTRVREHLRGDCPNQPRLRRRVRQIVDVEVIETGSELEALFLESKLIKRYLPEANVAGRGWRNYPFLKINLDEPFPRLEVTREPCEDGSRLFGPLRGTRSVTTAVESLNDVLGLRRCDGTIAPGMSACPLLDLKKCLGPCVRSGVRAEYHRAVGQVVELLEGADSGLLDRLAQKRDQLAEALRFEEAAVLRDTEQTLRRLLGDQQRLQQVAERNLVVVAPSRAVQGVELFVIQAGRLVDQLRVALPASKKELRRLLVSRFAEAAPRGPIEREVVDEMRQLESWLHREQSVLRTVPVDLADPIAALPELARVLSEWRVAGTAGASTRSSRSSTRQRPPQDVEQAGRQRGARYDPASRQPARVRSAIQVPS
jgi:excinuclease UvrABC nuclease subunit